MKQMGLDNNRNDQEQTISSNNASTTMPQPQGNREPRRTKVKARNRISPRNQNTTKKPDGKPRQKISPKSDFCTEEKAFCGHLVPPP